ncbi:MAG: flagellin FliC [Halobacteriovoraceae bacterium]|nr:flagellin FliC [Halobacteriovoraceae bacterium]MCB9095399.1 flagellin FliC [Halobacteriovoraceae bacterium]
MRINTNVAALKAHNYISDHSETIEHSTRKLALGSRIARASDDAAGLAISSKLSATILSKKQAMRNANDAIGFFQVAEGSLHQLSGLLNRIRQLSIQSMTDTVGSQERSLLNKEVQQLKNEMDRISESTLFLGERLLTGNEKVFKIMIDTQKDANHIFAIDIRDLAQTTEALGIDSLSIRSKEEAGEGLDKISKGLHKIGAGIAKIGAMHNKMNLAINNLNTQYENLSATNSKIKDLDYALETAENLSSKMKLSTSRISMQIATDVPKTILKLL